MAIKLRAVILILGMLIFCVCGAQAEAIAAEETGGLWQAKIVSLEGSVKVKKADRRRWKKASVGMLLESGDALKTGKDSYVLIGYEETLKDVTRIEENAELVVSKVEPTNLNLRRGRVFNIIENLPSGSSFRVETPTAVAGVKGTEFVVLVIEKTEVITTKGTVLVTDSLGKETSMTTWLKPVKLVLAEGEPARFAKISSQEIEHLKSIREKVTSDLNKIQQQAPRHETKIRPKASPPVTRIEGLKKEALRREADTRLATELRSTEDLQHIKDLQDTSWFGDLEKSLELDRTTTETTTTETREIAERTVASEETKIDSVEQQARIGQEPLIRDKITPDKRFVPEKRRIFLRTRTRQY